MLSQSLWKRWHCVHHWEEIITGSMQIKIGQEPEVDKNCVQSPFQSFNLFPLSSPKYFDSAEISHLCFASAKRRKLSGTFAITLAQTKYERNEDKNNIQELMFRAVFPFPVHAGDQVVVAIHNQLLAVGNGQLPGESFPLEFISLVQSCTNTNIHFTSLA